MRVLNGKFEIVGHRAVDKFLKDPTKHTRGHHIKPHNSFSVEFIPSNFVRREI